MFDGLPNDQLLHQFITPTTRTSSSTPNHSLPIPLQSQTTNNNTIVNHFDSFSHHHHHNQLLLPIHHHSQLQQHHELLHHNSLLHHNINVNDKAVKVHVAEIERSTTTVVDEEDDEPWGNDEILALLRIRSTTENWFPDFTWNQVSRKLAEIGFKLRSGEKCKEKFEEESRYFSQNNNNNNCSNKTFRPFLSELDELYNHSTQQQNDVVSVTIEPRKNTHSPVEQIEVTNNPIDLAAEDHTKKASEHHNNAKKRKRSVQVLEPSSSSSPMASASNKFEMFKGFCEEIVKKMMAQQEEMHNKLMEDMVRRDAENSRKEQDWKRKETERMNKELESMAHEQALAGDRQSAIIEFLTKFTSDQNKFSEPIIKKKKKKEFSLPAIAAQKVLVKSQITSSSSSTLVHEKSPNSENPSPQNPSAVTNNNHSPHTDMDSQSGKRWPRDEVLALINLRCNTLYSNNNGSSDNSNNKGNNIPLWERISQGMWEMGFKRSAKRCKEKWENINKYFRKTKDANKKRSVDSRTCPYFDQLSTLYSKGTLVHHHHNHDEDHHNHVIIDDIDHGQGERSETTTTITTTTTNNNIVVPSAFDFEF